MNTFDLKSFTKPVNVLIQGSRRGIGAGFVDALIGSSSVARVVATGRVQRACDEIRARHRDAGDKLIALPLDVEDERGIEAAAERVSSQLEELHLIVNCAGLLHDADAMQPERRLSEIVPENLHRSFTVNAVGPLLVAKHFAPLLPRRERAVFASLSARIGSIGDNRLGGWYAYRATKAAQNMFTRNLSIELPRRARGTLVVALHPGTVDTELSRPFQGGVADERLFTIERAVQQLLTVIDGLRPDDNGGFFAWDGKRIPW